MTIDSGSLHIEINKRLGVLYNNHHQWLTAVAYNKSKDKQVSQDLVQDLYVYLAEKQNPKIFFNDSFNLLYCYNFISSRFINYIKRENKTTYVSEWKDKPDNIYNVGEDKRLEYAYDCIKKELDTLKSSRMWSSAKLYELYAFSDLTMDELSKEVGISKSTVFLNIKKIKQHLKMMIDNPFKDITDETN
jgi:RNA polymerase sigma factor (sigma-70 family)